MRSITLYIFELIVEFHSGSSHWTTTSIRMETPWQEPWWTKASTTLLRATFTCSGWGIFLFVALISVFFTATRVFRGHHDPATTMSCGMTVTSVLTSWRSSRTTFATSTHVAQGNIMVVDCDYAFIMFFQGGVLPHPHLLRALGGRQSAATPQRARSL